METPESVAAALHRAAAELLQDTSSYANAMLDYLLERVPEAGADPELHGLTLGSCSSNIEAALSMVRHDIPADAAAAPATALEHARAMAARGYSVDVMLRFYRVGHAYFTDCIVPEVAQLVGDPAVALAVVARMQGFAFAYVDRISSQVALEYIAELDRRANQARAARTDVVRALIAADKVDLRHAERTLAHRLTGWQTGFVCWTDRDGVDLAPTGLAVAAQLGVRSPLLVPDGARALWGWVSGAEPARLGRDARAALLVDPSAPVRIALGAPAKGPLGFRDSHLEALRARRIMELSGTPRVVAEYPELALVDVMSQDIALARSFVIAELGDLASSGEREREERRALLAVLEAQGGLAAAALQLGLHRNTVLQRIRRAEGRRGRPATERLAELHAALRLLEQMGPALLEGR